MKRYWVWILVLIIAVAIYAADTFLTPKQDASLLLVLLFWSAVGQGIIALAAAADLSQGRWLGEARDYLLQYYPLLLMFPLAFLVFSRHLAIYPWLHHPNGWLDPQFFIIRNVVVLLLPFIAAHFYAAKREKGTGKKKGTGTWAVLYIAAFVTSQSFAAFDWAMTLEYPWINTLFGGYFFVEAFYGGIAFAAIMAAILFGRQKDRFKPIFKDTPIMLMGFALLWAGLFYSQYLVIWYGNIPEEASFLEKRLAIPILQYLGLYVLISLFIIPFILFISKRIKSSIPAVIAISVIVFSGLLLERFIILTPTTTIQPIPFTILFILFAIPFIILLAKQTAVSEL
jgi:hypothetical protein